MLATFQNRLQIEETPYQSPRVVYSHGRRLNLKIFIDYVPKQQAANGRDWRISMEGDKATIRETMNSLTHEIGSYFSQRTQKDFRELNFVTILDLAERMSIE